MKWNHEETGHPIDPKTSRFILPTDIRDQIEARMQVPCYEITYDDPGGNRRTFYESSDEAPIEKLAEQKRQQLLKDGCEIIASSIRWA